MMTWGDIMTKNEILNKHKYSIWQGDDGFYRTHLPYPNGTRKLLKRKTLESLNQGIIEFYREQLSNPTIEEVFYFWIQYKEQNNEIRPQSKDRYIQDFKRFFNYRNFKDTHIRYVTLSSLETFTRGVIREFNPTPKTFSGFKILLRGIFKYAKTNNLTKISITQFLGDTLVSPRSLAHVYKPKELEVFQEDELTRLLKYLYDNPDI